MESILIKNIIIGPRFRKDLGNIKDLAKSIEDVGLLHPIVLDKDNNLVAGFRRIKAFELLGRKDIPFHKLSIENIIQGELHENRERKNFTAFEMVAIKRVLEPEIEVKANERKKAQLKKGIKKPVKENFLNGETGQTRDIIAKYVGVSGRQLEKAEKIVEAYEKDPEKFGTLMENVDKGKTSINYAYQAVIRQEKHDRPPELPKGKYDVIYADPPWSYKFTAIGGNAEVHYPTLSFEDVCNLKIPTGKEAVLFLWATNPLINEALTVLRSWGFEYKTNLVWIKSGLGVGHYFRGDHELLLLGTKGKIPPPTSQNRHSSVLKVDKSRHSKKPYEVYELIEKMYPNRKYLELFARNTRSGWASWGNEI